MKSSSNTITDITDTLTCYNNPKTCNVNQMVNIVNGRRLEISYQMCPTLLVIEEHRSISCSS